MRPFDNRVEGTVEENQGNEDLTLLGINDHFENFGPNSILSVRFYIPAMDAEPTGTFLNSVFVQAREIVDFHHYAMKSNTKRWNPGSWNTFSPWPSRDVIDRLEISSDNLGVLAGYRDRGGILIYSPATVFTRNPPTDTQPYTIHFETAWDLHALDKFVIGPTGKSVPLKTDECHISPDCVLYPASTSHAFVVDLSSEPEGVYRIHLVGHVPGYTGKPDLTFLLYHRPHRPN